jgi:hypothetical protein
MHHTQKKIFPLIDSKKTLKVLKCFMCNQFFYAQAEFDLHMVDHQNKINKKIP